MAAAWGIPFGQVFGGVIRNNLGTYIAGFSRSINNSHDILFAELTTLYKGLTSLNFEEMVCYSGSLLNLINDDYSRYHIYVVLIQNIKDFLSAGNFSLRHSLREGNQCADFMAKLRASTDDVFTIHSSPPQLLLPLLRAYEIGSFD